jgi:hypothetical protein
MSNIISFPTMAGPLYVGNVAGSPVRFFRSPLSIPDAPWCSYDDLLLALRFPRDFRRKMRREPLRDVRTLYTSKDEVAVIDRDHAQGMVGAAIDLGFAPKSAESDYGHALIQALNLLTDGWPDREASEYRFRAFLNHLPDGDDRAASLADLFHPKRQP